jgi:UDPglucose 6-dehydrogenase
MAAPSGVEPRTIFVVGAGVVGEATGTGLAAHGHCVTFVDVCPQRIAYLRSRGLTAATADELDWSEAHIVMLAVSTPTVDGRIVLGPIEAAAAAVGRGLRQARAFVVVAVRSTVLPTTTEKVLTPILERESGRRAGIDFGVAVNPEFLRQRSSAQDFAHPWVTVLGTSDERTADVLRALYTPFGGLIFGRCTPSEAEMIKYVSNIYNAVKISYFNEVHAICRQLGIDSGVIGAAVARSAESMWNPLYGTRGGAAYGGACLPKDTRAFMRFCQENGSQHQLLEATIRVNEELDAPALTAPYRPASTDIVAAVLSRGQSGTAAADGMDGVGLEALDRARLPAERARHPTRPRGDMPVVPA